MRNVLCLCIVFGLMLTALALSGCVSSSVQYDPVAHVYTAHRIAVLTNIGSLHATVSSPAITATVDEQAIDQTTAAAQAVTAAAQALSAAAKVAAP